MRHLTFFGLFFGFSLILSTGAAFAEVDVGARPSLELPAAGGGKVDLADHRGKVVLVDFWATWCQPCRKSLPFYGELHERYADRGLVVLAVNIDEERRLASAYLERHELPFVVLFDTKQQAVARFGPPTMPTSYLLDRDGVVRHRHEGFRDADRAALEAKIKALLGQEE